MNQGIFSFPNPKYSSTVIDIKEFDTSGTYIIPTGSKRLWIMLVGAGSGGGGGRRSATNIAAYGGGGGAGGNLNTGYYFVSDLGGDSSIVGGGGTPIQPFSAWGKTLTVVLGAGGAGGNAATGDSTDGSSGSRGGDSYVQITGSNPNGSIMWAYGGATYSTPFGGGGTTSSGSGGLASGVAGWPLMNGFPSGNASTTFSQNGASSSISGIGSIIAYHYSCNGGAAGGGISTGNVGFNGGNITAGAISSSIISTINNIILSSGSVKLGTSANSNSSPVYEEISIGGPYTPGVGGPGGGSGVTTNAGNGSNGWRGSGGGGGGAARNGFTAGNGGRGGNGYCVIVALG